VSVVNDIHDGVKRQLLVVGEQLISDWLSRLSVK